MFRDVPFPTIRNVYKKNQRDHQLVTLRHHSFASFDLKWFFSFELDNRGVQRFFRGLSERSFAYLRGSWKKKQYTKIGVDFCLILISSGVLASVQRFCAPEKLGQTDDTFLGRPGDMSSWKCFEIWFSEMAFPAFWGHFWAKSKGLKSHFSTVYVIILRKLRQFPDGSDLQKSRGY